MLNAPSPNNESSPRLEIALMISSNFVS